MENTKLAERLRELRSSFNYSQAFVAQKLNISRQTYSHYETGRIIPPTDSLRALAQLYQISMDVLLPVEHSTDLSIDISRPFCIPSSDYNLSIEYTNYVSSPKNKSRFSSLTATEKRLLFYYHMLTPEDQQDIMTFMKIKAARKKSKKG